MQINLYDDELEIIEKGHVMRKHDVPKGATEAEVRALLYTHHGKIVAEAPLEDMR